MTLPIIFANQSAPELVWLDEDFAAVGALTTIPCIVTGTNAIVLVPFANTPAVPSYTNYLRLSGIAASTNTGSVTVQLGSLTVLPVYKDTATGPVPLAGSEIHINNAVAFIYDQALNSGSGGFHFNAPSSSGLGTGTVTSVGSGTGLTGGPITTSGSLSLAPISTLTLLANITGGSAAPAPNSMSAILDAAFGASQGNILFRAGSLWQALGPGTSGQFLETQGAGANPVWAAPSGSGTVNSGGSGQIAYYATAGSAVSGTSTPTATSFNGSTLATHTRQVFTSGTAQTYTTATNARQIVVRMAGGGGGGGGSGTSGNGSGTVGNATSFNSIAAAGGAAGNGNGAGGIGGTGGAGSASVRQAGQSGSDGASSLSTLAAVSPTGGSSVLGGGAGGGHAAVANTGGGGAGASISAIASGNAGGAGGGGEYVELIITSPSASYTYTVGASAAGGVAGSSGNAGLAGGSGIIIVDEYY